MKVHGPRVSNPQPSAAAAVCVARWGAGGVCSLPSVLPQEADIDSIHQLVVGATENIKEGNEDIREVCAHPTHPRPRPRPGVRSVVPLGAHRSDLGPGVFSAGSDPLPWT